MNMKFFSHKFIRAIEQIYFTFSNWKMKNIRGVISLL